MCVVGADDGRIAFHASFGKVLYSADTVNTSQLQAQNLDVFRSRMQPRRIAADWKHNVKLWNRRALAAR
jgi:hypothetical protein